MKTFKQFLTEKVTHAISKDDADVSVIKSLLKERSSKILNAYKNNQTLLYRGMISESKSKIDFYTLGSENIGDNDFIMGKSRDNRKPLDTSVEYNELLHDVFIKMGYKATRKNSIFTTSVKRIAKAWGILYVIFPFDDANITWVNLDKIEQDYPYYTLKKILDEFNRNPDTKVSKEDYFANKIKKMLNPISGDIDNALKHKNIEVLINGNYYGIREDSELWTKEIEPWIKAQ